MKISKMLVTMIVLVIGVAATIAICEEPAINPARITTPQIVVYGTASDSTFAGGVTASSVTASGLVKTYGYATEVGPSATQVYMTQSGKLTANAETIKTQAFTVAFIEVPALVVSYNGPGATNIAYTVVSNQFTITWQTNTSWIARGRIK